MEQKGWQELYAPTFGFLFLYTYALVLLGATFNTIGTYGSQQIPLFLLVATPVAIVFLLFPAFILSLTVSKWVARLKIGKLTRLFFILLPMVSYAICWYFLAVSE